MRVWSRSGGREGVTEVPNNLPKFDLETTNNANNTL